MSFPGPISPTTEQLVAWGLEPTWSRRVSVSVHGAEPVDWHVLDTGPGPLGTIVCTHGNPSWAYLWRDVLETLSPSWRVIAVDQTNMGFSERAGPRRLAHRVVELVSFCRQEVDGPLVLAAHDWGGPVAVGAAAELDVSALVLANTAVAKPDDVKVPPLIALARRATAVVCQATPTFVEGAARMTDRRHRAALRAPYRTSARRAAVATFVEDIPLSPSDPSFDALAASAASLQAFGGPVLLVWGGRDPVFNDRFLRDLRNRVPHADVQRFASASHYVPLDEPIGAVMRDWLDRVLNGVDHLVDGVDVDGVDLEGDDASLLATLAAHSDDASPLYVGPEGALSWHELDRRSETATKVLVANGLARGDRVSVLIPPGPELLVAALATWRAGAVPVVADASGGLAQLRRLVRATAPRFVIGTTRTLVASVALGIAPGARRAGFSASRGVIDLRSAPEVTRASAPPSTPAPHDVAAIVHTSGSTGPAKAVRYTHGALAAVRPALQALGLAPGGAFVTSFGPFMLLAPVLDMTCVRPDFKVDEPAALGFDQLRASLALAKVTAAWLSPAAARTVVATAQGRRVELDLVMLAGAPIPPALAGEVANVTGAEVRTPYGMTECLPVTDGVAFEAVGSQGGFSTGRAVGGCRVRINALDDPLEDLTERGRWGEILVSAPWMFDGYEGDWRSTQLSRQTVDGVRFHRTGDVGYLEDGLLFHLGRLAHVIRTATGPLASVAVEGPVARQLGRDVAAVGVGPPGAEVLCLVVRGDGALSLADPDVAAAVRACVPHRVAAVLCGTLPVDHRHQSKIDRSALGASAAALLAGR